MTTDLFDQIEAFKVLSKRNAWIIGDEMKIYLRKSYRFLEGKLHSCIDFGNVEVFKQGKGTFTSFLHEFQRRYPKENIFVESILTQRFSDFFEKNGFMLLSNEEPMQIDMYLLNTKK